MALQLSNFTKRRVPCGHSLVAARHVLAHRLVFVHPGLRNTAQVVQVQVRRRTLEWLDDDEGEEDEFGVGRGDIDFMYDMAPIPEPQRNQEKRTINGKPVLVNDEIRAREVRVLSQNKEMLGVMMLREALSIAEEEDVDLVLLSGDQTPPLCRLVSWSKYKYETEKAEKTKKKGSNVVELKEVRLRPTTDTNDLQVKLKTVSKFLEKGNKVKLTMKFEGRELQFKDQGKEVLLKFIESLKDVGKVEGPLNFKTGTYNIILTPTKSEAKV